MSKNHKKESEKKEKSTNEKTQSSYQQDKNFTSKDLKINDSIKKKK